MSEMRDRPRPDLSPAGAPCLLQPGEIDALIALIGSVARTSGVDGRPRYHPDPQSIDAAVIGPLVRDQIDKPLDVPNWRRVWAYCRDGEVVAQAELRGAATATALHRAHLGMSMDVSLQGHGVGRRLLEHVIDWARDNELAWIDLGVFAENLPAIQLYEKLGFVKTGALEDVFRLPGGQVDDVRMSLDLRR